MTKIFNMLTVVSIMLLVVYSPTVVAQKQLRIAPLFEEQVQKQIKDWTFLIYMNIDQLGQYAIQNINDIAAAMRSDTTNVIVCCNYSGLKAWVWELQEQVIKHIKHVDTIFSHSVMLPTLMTQVVDKYPARQYGIVLWGHGSGAVDNVFNHDRGQWEHPAMPLGCADSLCSLRAPCTASALARGILYDNTSMTCMTNQQIADACREIVQILPKAKLDVLITDACGMADIAIATALADSVSYLGGTQDCQRPDGIAYKQTFNELNKRGVLADELICATVREYGLLHNRLSPYGAHTYAGIDCAAAAIAWDLFHSFLSCLNPLIQDNTLLAQSVYQVRRSVASSSLHADYIDMQDWIGQLIGVLWPINAEGGAAAFSAACLLQGALKKAVLATTSGVGALNKLGLSFYYPYSKTDLVLDRKDPWHLFLLNSTAFLAAHFTDD
jgi:hypothetical protein